MFGLFQLINTLQPFSSQMLPTSEDLASMGGHSLTAVVKSLTTMQTHTYIPCSGSLWHTPILSIHFPEDKTMRKKNQDWSSHFKKQKTCNRWYNLLLYNVQATDGITFFCTMSNFSSLKTLTLLAPAGLFSISTCQSIQELTCQKFVLFIY